MKKVLFILTSSVLMLSSCGTYTGEGAATGAAFGSILGSAIGGISGGWRGHDVGTIVGMAGGAVVGAAIGSAADRQEQRKYEAYQEEQERYRHQRQYDDSGFDASGRGDDRINFDAPGPRDGKGSYTAATSHCLWTCLPLLVSMFPTGFSRLGKANCPQPSTLTNCISFLAAWIRLMMTNRGLSRWSIGLSALIATGPN